VRPEGLGKLKKKFVHLGDLVDLLIIQTVHSIKLSEGQGIIDRNGEEKSPCIVLGQNFGVLRNGQRKTKINIWTF
jgi:hypothetical protein